MDVNTVSTKLSEQPTAHLIDVREPDEYMEVHAEPAELYPLSLFPDNFMSHNVPKDTPLYLICKSGGRSQKALEQLETLGYSNLTNVEGGTDAWVVAGLPVV